jgi:hypothetical protein
VGNFLALQVVKIPIDFIHPAVFATVFDVELMGDIFKVLLPFMVLPDLLKRIGIDISILKSLIQQIRTASVN